VSSRGSTIHEAARGFEHAPKPYEIGRPPYPPEAIERLVAELGIEDGRRVLDLAAGTGKLTRLLVPTGAFVVAVEPVEAMRAALTKSLPQVEAVAGTAEAIPLPDGSVDAVTVGQAFHWFDGPRALAEIERVLRPGGALALVWNRRPVESSALHKAISEIIAPYRGDAPSHGSGAWRVAFAGRELTEERFDFTQRLDADGLADRVGSTSFVAALDDATRESLLVRVRALAPDGPLDVPYQCEIHLWRP
jgi:SAM-dependent methyltransferase